MIDARFASRCLEWIHKTYAPSRFDFVKLASVNKHYIKEKSEEE